MTNPETEESAHSHLSDRGWRTVALNGLAFLVVINGLLAFSTHSGKSYHSALRFSRASGARNSATRTSTPRSASPRIGGACFSGSVTKCSGRGRSSA